MFKTLSDLSGVYTSAIPCGIKKDKLDLAYIYVPKAVASAAVFTTNLFCAPCITRNRQALSTAVTKAIIINSGNANVMTGPEGITSTNQSAEEAAKLLTLKPEEILTASTGIIGVRFPIEKLSTGLQTLLRDPLQRHGSLTAEAILTTDLVKKEVYQVEKITGGNLEIAGIAKGSGMIAPNMATMLAFLVVNVDIHSSDLQKMLKVAVHNSFNMISVDTDTSTSDQVIVIATGEVKITTSEFPILQKILNEACCSLAKKIARDGEGATKLIEVRVTGAKSEADARTVARSIGDSPLIKTAVHGADPNWGRVIMAVGKHPEVTLDPTKLDLAFQGITVLNKSNPTGVTRSELKTLLEAESVVIDVNLNSGSEQATFWSCDLTKGYIDINVDYN